MESLKDDLSRTVRKAREHRHAYRLSAFPGSRADRELKEVGENPVHQEMVETTYSTALLLVIASEDALESMELLFEATELHPFSAAVLTRSVLEWCATAGWLVEDGLNLRGRTARGITNYLHGLWRQQQMIIDSEDDDLLKKAIRGRITQEVKEAEEAGYEVLGGKGWLYHIDAPRPPATQLVADLLACYERAPNGDNPEERMGRLLYRYYSGIAHGAPQSLLEFFEPLPEAGGGIVVKQPRPIDIERPAALAILGFIEAFGRLVGVYGWDESHWKGWRATVTPRCFHRILGMMSPEEVRLFANE